jgi:hypothetical protein
MSVSEMCEKLRVLNRKNVVGDDIEELLNPYDERSLLEETEISNIVVELKKMYVGYDEYEEQC